jgi:N4-gp56 family major capsid protein
VYSEQPLFQGWSHVPYQFNFALLTDEQKTAWSLDFWKQARNQSFFSKFLGRGQNALIQRITELTRTSKGTRAVLTLLADLEGDGIAGDRMLEGNEEPGKSYDVVIQLDQLRHAMRHEGKMADQKSVVNFRQTARDRLAYWIADRMDQLAFLTMAGIPYTSNTNGTTRVGSDLKNLEFAADVLPPSGKRVAQWDDASGLVIGGATSAITPADTPAWKMFIEAKAYAKENYIRGVMVNGEETYHAFLSPMAMSRLKVDPDYLANLRHAQSRGDKNELFTGTSVKIDGIYLHEFRHVPNTRLAPVGSGPTFPAAISSTTRRSISPDSPGA